MRKFDFQDRFDILLEMRLSCVAEQGYTMLYGKSQFKVIFIKLLGLYGENNVL